MAEKMWAGEPFWGLGYEWDPDWVLTDRQRELRELLIELCQTEMRANAKDSDDGLIFHRKNLELLGRHGFLALTVPTAGAEIRTGVPMWTYWYLQEGELAIDPAGFTTNDGQSSPVLHVDSDQPLHSDEGRLITDEPWGVYFKPDRDTIQGGAQPLTVGPDFEVDPYPTGTVDPGFPDMWSAALSHCLGRFENGRMYYRQVRSGGVGAFTVDNFPVFDFMRPNVFVIADSNHGYKMIAVGREVARIVRGEHSSLLQPFRFGRFATGDLHPVSHSPYPWS